MNIHGQLWKKETLDYNKAMADKKNNSSPDISVPSVAETVASSQPGEEVEEENISRVLFVDEVIEIEVEEEEEQEVVENIQKVKEEKESKENRGETEQISITSSETTVVAASNLSPQIENSDKPKPAKKNEELYLLEEESSITRNSSDEDEDEAFMEGKSGAFPVCKEQKRRKTLVTIVETSNEHQDTPPFQIRDTNPKIVVEDPPKDFTTCNQALKMTPKQISDMFQAIEGKRNTLWPTASRQDNALKGSSTFGSDCSKASRWIEGWIPQSDALEKENKPPEVMKEEDNLKDAMKSGFDLSASWIEGWMPQKATEINQKPELTSIMKENSITLLSLKQAVETQRELNALKEIEIEEKEKDLLLAKQVLKALTKEKEGFKEREEDLLDTIEILKSEIENFTIRNAELEEARMMELQAEREDWKVQVHQQELVIMELRKAIEEKEQENLTLREEVKKLEDKRLLNEEDVCEQEIEDLKLEEEKGHIDLTSETPCAVDSNAVDLQSEKLSPSERPKSTEKAEASSELREIVVSISKRLEAVELELEAVELDKNRAETLFIQKLKQKDEEIDEIRSLLKGEQQQEETEDHTAQDPDERNAIAEKSQEVAVKEKAEEGFEAILKNTEEYAIADNTSACCCFSSAITSNTD